MVILLCFTFGCQQSGEIPDVSDIDIEADVAAINKINEEWNTAYHAEDIEKLVSVFTDSAVRFPPNESVLMGKEAIRVDFQELFNQFTVEQESVLQDVKVSGDIAYVRGSWKSTNTPKAEGEPLELRGSFVSINQKQPDGSWKTVFNSWSDEQLTLPLHMGIFMQIPVIQDAVMMKNGDFLNGIISTETFHIESSYGNIALQRDEIAQIHIKGTQQYFKDEIHTLEMNKFTGTIEEKSIDESLQN